MGTILRVLHITTGLENGGAEAVLYGLVSSDRSGTTHEIVSLTDFGFYGERLVREGFRVDALQMPRGKVTAAALIRLYRLLRDARPDRVQTWMYHANLIGGLLARIAGVRVIWSIHHSDLDPAKVSASTRFVARLCAWLSRCVPARILYCSGKAAEAHVALGYSARRTVVVNNGVDIERFLPDAAERARVRAEWSIGGGQLLLGMVARWDPLKDHANLLAALASVLPQLPVGCRLAFVGPGMVRSNSEVVALVAQHGLQDRILLAGVRQDVPAVMNALDLHVLSSSGEAFGNVTVEAMACGVPAIVTSAGAGAEIVGGTGWVVSPRDSAALGKALVAAIRSMAAGDDWCRRKQACRERVIERFSLERMIVAYRNVWQGAS